MLFGRKINELFALRLLASCVKTGNPEGTLRVAQEILSKRGKSREASVIEDIRYRISELGDSLVSAFHGAGAISEDRYHLLSLMEDKGNLTAEPIEGLVSVAEDASRLKKEAYSALLMPLLTVLGASFVGAFVVSRVWNILEAMKIEAGGLFVLHQFVASNFLLGGAFMAGASVAFVLFMVNFLMGRSIKNAEKLFSVAGVVASLRQQKVTYAEIFKFLGLVEKNRKYRGIYSDIGYLAETEDPSDFLLPLAEMMSIDLSASFLTYIRNGEEIRAWRLVRDEMKTQAFVNIKRVSSLMPAVAYLCILGIFIFALAPMGMLIMKLSGGLAGGSF